MSKKFIWIIVLIIAAVLFVVASGVFLLGNKQINTLPITILPFGENLSCQEMYDEIENDINRANYCKTDSDCDVLMLGGWYVDFGCYHFINKAVDKNQFYKKMDVYKQKCSQTINDCAPALNASCVENKCVYTIPRGL